MTRQPIRLLTWLLVGAFTLIGSLFWTSDALADNVPSGLDYYETVPGHTYIDFSANPIPLSFFEPSSEPFDGVVKFKGVPTGPGTTDTIIRRSQIAILLPPFPSTDTVPIELVQLSLVSTSPITVRFPSGPPQKWDVWVFPSPSVPSQGQMKITHSHPNGGTFDSVLYVCPVFVFVNKADLSTRVLDPCLHDPPIQFGAAGVPWCHDVGLPHYVGVGQDFIPGVTCHGAGHLHGLRFVLEAQSQVARLVFRPASDRDDHIPPRVLEELQIALAALAGH